MPPLGYFGIESSGLNLAVDLLILFVAVLYLATIYWVYTDARRRIVDPMLVGCATAAALFPFVGAIIYMILRPPEYIEDVHERELEIQAAEARVRADEGTLCPHCDYRIESDFVRCPSCLRKLKERCTNCSRPLDQAWTICPYCEADVPGLASTRSRRRRKAAVVEEADLPPLEETLTAEEVDVIDPVVDPETEEAAPLAATEAARRPRGRATRPSSSRRRPASS
jgi:hypothetical protein